MSVVAERFIKTLKNKIYKHMTAVSKNVYFDVKVGDDVKISKSKKCFAEGHTPNWNEEIFMVRKVKNTVPWT